MPTPPTAELLTDEPMQRVTPANADNLFTVRRPTSLAKEQTVFMTCSKVEVVAMLKKEKQQASASSTFLDMKPPYSVKEVSRPYSTEYIVPNFQKFDSYKGNNTSYLR